MCRYGLLSDLSTMVCRSVCDTGEPCKNSWTDRDSVRVVFLGALKEPCIRWGSKAPMARGYFAGKGVAVGSCAKTSELMTCRLGYRVRWTQGTMYGGRDPPMRTGNFEGGKRQPITKYRDFCCELFIDSCKANSWCDILCYWYLFLLVIISEFCSHFLSNDEWHFLFLHAVFHDIRCKWRCDC